MENNVLEENNELGTEKISKLLFKFSVPAIIGMVVNMLYNIIDRIYIGNIPDIGGLAITGVGIATPITVIITGLGMLIGVGTSANISLALGKRKRKDAQGFLNMGFVMTIIMSIIIAIFGNMFLTNIVALFGGTESTMMYALAYLRPLLFGSLFNLIAFSLNNSISSDGNPKIGMYTMIFGALVNLILDPILIFGFNLGIKGAAYATVISQCVASIWVLYYFIYNKKAKLHLRKNTFSFDKKYFKPIILVGLAPCLMQIANSFVQVLANNALLQYGGDLAIGSMAVISTICSICIMPIYGLNQGSQPLIGYNYGAKKYDRVKKTYFIGLFSSTILLSFFYILILFCPQFLIEIFNKDPELTNIAPGGIRLFLCSLPLIGIQMTASNFFQSIGNSKKALFIGLTRQVIFLIPALLILPNMFGLKGVWLAGPTGDVLAILVSSVIMIREMKKIKRMEFNGENL